MSYLPNVHISRPSLKAILFGGLGSSVGVLGVLLAVGLYIVQALTRPKRIMHFMDLYTFSPYEFHMPAEEVTFPPLHGNYVVSGWFVSHPQATSTIIICPGYRGKRSDVLGMCSHLWQAGHNVLVFEYYGHGTVVGTPVTLGYREINDFQGAVAYVKQRAPQTRLGAMGYSMGGSVALMATARRRSRQSSPIAPLQPTKARSSMPFGARCICPSPSLIGLPISSYGYEPAIISSRSSHYAISDSSPHVPFCSFTA
jgi:uncharacterized protein